ncbi:hypothetical protein Q3G72_029304 [Acer saccharum]|nr:hypothetical protein Q3G72_029304 [Acer saccharum]
MEPEPAGSGGTGHIAVPVPVPIPPNHGTRTAGSEPEPCQKPGVSLSSAWVLRRFSLITYENGCIFLLVVVGTRPHYAMITIELV